MSDKQKQTNSKPAQPRRPDGSAEKSAEPTAAQAAENVAQEAPQQSQGQPRFQVPFAHPDEIHLLYTMGRKGLTAMTNENEEPETLNACSNLLIRLKQVHRLILQELENQAQRQAQEQQVAESQS